MVNYAVKLLHHRLAGAPWPRSRPRPTFCKRQAQALSNIPPQFSWKHPLLALQPTHHAMGSQLARRG